MDAKFIKPFCISAYIVHPHPDTPLYLLIRRCSKYLPGTWQMVSGGVHDGEPAWQAALREIFEETGLVPDRFYNADAVETFYMQGLDAIIHAPAFVAFIDELRPITLSPREHDAYEWLPLDQAIEKVVWAEQKRVLRHIHENYLLKPPHPLLRIIN